MRETRYELELEPGRLRVRFMIRDPQPPPRASWSVQLELYHERLGAWRWIVRYDDAGGAGHRDRYGIERHERLALPPDRGEAARLALMDLRERAEDYTGAYRASGEEGRRR